MSNLADCDLHRQMPDLILLDLNMPYMDGRTVLASIKEDQKYSKIPIVILTASENAIDRFFGKMIKTPFFRKGYDKEECLALLKMIFQTYLPSAAISR